MDKTTSKNFLWTEICLKMNKAGFFVGEGTEGREKCRQKFVNLQSSYMKYMDKKRNTGEGKIEKPPYYDYLDEILGDKDKTQPVFLLDSTIGTSTGISIASPSSITNDCSQPSTSKGITSSNRFTVESIKSSVAPKKNEMLEKFYVLAEKSERRREKEFTAMIGLVREESQRKHEQILALIHTLNKREDTGKLKKRKRKNSNESDEDEL